MNVVIFASTTNRATYFKQGKKILYLKAALIQKVTVKKIK